MCIPCRADFFHRHKNFHTASFRLFRLQHAPHAMVGHRFMVGVLICSCASLTAAFVFLDSDLPRHTDFAFHSRSGIPLVLHLTWKTTSVPANLHRYLASWIKYNPHWKIAYWTDASSRALVAEK